MSIFFNEKEAPAEIVLSVDDFKKELGALIVKYGFKKRPIKTYDGGGAFVCCQMYLTKNNETDYRATIKEIIVSLFGNLGL